MFRFIYKTIPKNIKALQFVFCVIVLLMLTGCLKEKKQNSKTDKFEKERKTTSTLSNIEYPYSFKFEGNPLVKHHSAADPDVQVWDGKVWMYCSQDHEMRPGDSGTYDAMDGYHAFSSTDLVNWTDHGEVLHSKNIKWGVDGWMWAPGAARKNGKYYLYYPHKDKENVWRIGVAIANSPAGPFKDIGKPIEGIIGIDPKVFIDDDNEAYLYNNKAIIAKLKTNMIELAESTKKIDYAPENIKKNDTLKFLEGAYMHKKDNKYYYSYTNWKNNTSQGYYGIGDSPYGPFEWKGAMAPKAEGAQDHHSIVKFNKNWYYFYHIGGNRFKTKGWKGERRIACFDKLFYNEDGTIKMVKHTYNVNHD